MKQAHGTNLLHRRRRQRRRAMTFVELVLGLAVTSLIMTGAASVFYSVAQGWEAQSTTDSIAMQGKQIAARLQYYLSGAKYVPQYAPGSLTVAGTPAALFFWMNDNWTNPPDGAVETAEMAVLAYDPATHSLFLYQAMPATQMTPGQFGRAGTQLNTADLTAGDAIANFEALDFLSPRQCVAGPGDLPDDGTHVRVVAVQFFVYNIDCPSALPVVEFSITLSSPDGETFTVYGSSTLRSPTTRPQ